MPKYTDMLQLCAADALPAPALGAPLPRGPARPVAPAWAPVAGKPHLWQSPGGALAYRPPTPEEMMKKTTGNPAPDVHASQVGKVDMFVGKPRGLYKVKRQGLDPAFRYWDGDSLSNSFSEATVEKHVHLRTTNLGAPGEGGSIQWVTPIEDIAHPIYRKLKHMGLL